MAAAIARSVLQRKKKWIPLCVRVSTLLSNNVCGKGVNVVSSKTRNFSHTLRPAWSPDRCMFLSDVSVSRLFSTHSLGNDNFQQEEHHAIEELDEGSRDGELHNDGALLSPVVFEPVNPDKGAQELLLVKPPEQPENPRCLRVAIVGTPNAGKSTLVNTLLGRRICAVSKKVHTTRRQAIAVLTERDTQVIILDTPGMVTKDSARRHSLPRELIISPKSSLELADLIVVMVDVADKWTCRKISTDILMELNSFQETPCILVLNKVDVLKNKQSLVELTALLTDGVVDGKPIEMSGRLSKKLLKNKGFRRKYLQYKRLSAGQGKGADEETGDEMLRSTIEEEEPEMAASAYELGVRLSESPSGESPSETISESGINSEDLKEEAASPYELDVRLSESPSETISESEIYSEDLKEEMSDIRKDNYITSEDVIIDEMDDVEGNYSNTDELSSRIFQKEDDQMSSQKLNLLNEYINNLDSISKVYHSKESDNTEEKIKQLAANRKQRELLKEFSERSGWHLFEKVFMISATTGDGVNELKEFLMETAKPAEWEYHKKVVTDLSPSEILEEAVREQLLECLPQEIPYNIHQQNEYWDYDDNGTLLINQRLICFKKTHYNVILRKIRTIAKRSEQDIMNAFHCDVVLILKVKLSK